MSWGETPLNSRAGFLLPGEEKKEMKTFPLLLLIGGALIAACGGIPTPPADPPLVIEVEVTREVEVFVTREGAVIVVTATVSPTVTPSATAIDVGALCAASSDGRITVMGVAAQCPATPTSSPPSVTVTPTVTPTPNLWVAATTTSTTEAVVSVTDVTTASNGATVTAEYCHGNGGGYDCKWGDSGQTPTPHKPLP